MTNNHLLLYRLAELMLEKQQHILALDDLFEDEQIGAFVRSIQIDSPYQQLIFEGLLSETIKEERVMVTFTVEGYFHYVLGEVIEKQTRGKGAEALKELLENNQLRGITEGVEQCLVRDVEKNDLSRLMWLIDEGGKTLEASAYPLAQAFLIHPIKRVMDELLADSTDNDIEVLEKAIEKLNEGEKNSLIKDIYLVINKNITPKDIKTFELYAKTIKHLDPHKRIESINELLKINIKISNKEKQKYWMTIGGLYEHVQEYEKSLIHFKKANKIILKKGNNDNKITILRYIGFLLNDMGQYEEALNYHKKSLKQTIDLYGNDNIKTAIAYGNIGLDYLDLGKYDKSKYDLAIKNHVKEKKIFLKECGKFSPEMAMCFFNIGAVNYWKGNYEKALDFYKRSYEINIKCFGENHSKIAKLNSNIGMVYKEQNKLVEALANYNKALKIFKKNHGEYFHSVSNTYNNIGTIEKQKGNFEKAIYYYQKAIKIDKKIFGLDHISIANKYFNIGLVYKTKEEYNKVIKYYEKSLKIKIVNFGPNHSKVVDQYYDLSKAYREVSNYKKALFSANKVLKYDIKNYGLVHKYTAADFSLISSIYDEMKNYKMALKNVENAFASNPINYYYPYKIGEYHEKLKNISQAIKNYVISANILKEQNGIEDEDTKEAIQEVIRLAKETNNLELLPIWIKKIAN
jgi:tetratricopeptide (TPR) repeat protein